MAALKSSQDASTSAAVSQHRDWSINLGTGRIQFGQYPPKWNADPNVAPICAIDAQHPLPDCVVYVLNVAGATGGEANLIGLTNLYSGGTNPLCPFAQPLFLFSFNTTTGSSSAGLGKPYSDLEPA